MTWAHPGTEGPQEMHRTPFPPRLPWMGLSWSRGLGPPLPAPVTPPWRHTLVPSMPALPPEQRARRGLQEKVFLQPWGP